MGLFQKEYGQDTQVPASQPNTDQRFEELKAKYASVLHLIEQSPGVQLKNLNVQNNGLFIKGTVSSEQLKNRIWDEIKRVDPTYSDLTADLTAEPGTDLQDPGAQRPGGQAYTVQPGDTLSKIAEHFYGSADGYMAIFDANRDQLSDPNLIQPGQVLTIPPQ